MEKRISINEFRSAVRVAQATNPLQVQRDKVRAKIEKLAAEYKAYDTQIQALEAGIVQILGLRVEEIVKKVIEPGVDANGNPKRTTKYLPTDIVSYDNDKKQYVITLKDDEGAQVQPLAGDDDTLHEVEPVEAETIFNQ